MTNSSDTEEVNQENFVPNSPLAFKSNGFEFSNINSTLLQSGKHDATPSARMPSGSNSANSMSEFNVEQKTKAGTQSNLPIAMLDSSLVNNKLSIQKKDRFPMWCAQMQCYF
jgi:hypothetical protein